jgi:hypothetical protein
MIGDNLVLTKLDILIILRRSLNYVRLNLKPCRVSSIFRESDRKAKLRVLIITISLIGFPVNKIQIRLDLIRNNK